MNRSRTEDRIFHPKIEVPSSFFHTDCGEWTSTFLKSFRYKRNQSKYKDPDIINCRTVKQNIGQDVQVADKGKTIIKIQFRGVHIKKKKEKKRSVSILWLTASEAERCSLNFRAAIGWISALSRKLVAQSQHIMFCGTRAGGDGSPPKLSAEQRQELWELWAAKREKNIQMEQEGDESGRKRNKAGANGSALIRWRISTAVSTSGLCYCVDDEVQWPLHEIILKSYMGVYLLTGVELLVRLEVYSPLVVSSCLGIKSLPEVRQINK